MAFDWDEILVTKDPDNKEVSVNFKAVDGLPLEASPPSELCVRIYSNETFTHITGSAHWVWLELTAAPDRYVKVRLDFDAGNGIGEPSPSPQYAEFFPGDDRTLQFALSAGVASELLNTSNYRATATIEGTSCGVSQATVEFAKNVIPPDPEPDPDEDTGGDGDPIDGENPECEPHDCDALTEDAFIEANRRIAIFVNTPPVNAGNSFLNFEGDPVGHFSANTSFVDWFKWGPMLTEGPCTFNNINHPSGVNSVIRDGTPASPATSVSRIIEQNPGAGFGSGATRSNIGTTSISGTVRFWYYPYVGDPDTLTNGVFDLSLYGAGHRIYADAGLNQTFSPGSVYLDAANGVMGITNGPKIDYDPTKWWLPVTYKWESNLIIRTEENGGQYPGFPLGPVDIMENNRVEQVEYNGNTIYLATPDTRIGVYVATAGFREENGTDDFAGLVAVPTSTVLVAYVRDPTEEDNLSRHFQGYTPPTYCTRIP